MNTQILPSFAVAGIGEILWDVFPHRSRIGGAPANFAWHCSQLGAVSCPISRVGTDSLGRQLQKELNERRVDTSFLQSDSQYPTGQAKVTFDASGKPSYDIVKNVAWDHLEMTKPFERLATTLDAACFGTLCQRSPVSRGTIQAILKWMPPSSLKIFDVNLRQSYHNKDLVDTSLQLANVLKLSDEELPTLSSYFKLTGSVSKKLEQLRSHFDLQLLVYTRGAEGSLLLNADSCDEHPGMPTEVLDSVGAGDSFTAAICIGALQKWPLDRINAFANQIAAFVCSQPGATPELPSHLTLNNQPTVLPQ